MCYKGDEVSHGSILRPRHHSCIPPLFSTNFLSVQPPGTIAISIAFPFLPHTLSKLKNLPLPPPPSAPLVFLGEDEGTGWMDGSTHLHFVPASAFIYWLNLHFFWYLNFRNDHLIKKVPLEGIDLFKQPPTLYQSTLPSYFD